MLSSIRERHITNFVTNVQGSAHPESSSIYKVNKTLTGAFSIPSFVWWRDELDARLDNASDIKWSYPEICRATDVLQFLLLHSEARTEIGATRAIAAYIGKQHDDDRDVKFKQVERRITDLFVDIQIGRKASYRERRRAQSDTRELRQVEEYLDQLCEYENYDDDDDPSSHEGLTAGFLLHMPIGKGVSRFAFESAPGQGKPKPHFRLSVSTSKSRYFNNLRLPYQAHTPLAIGSQIEECSGSSPNEGVRRRLYFRSSHNG